MNALLSIYRRVDALQKKQWFKIAASILVVIGVIVDVALVSSVEVNPNIDRTVLWLYMNRFMIAGVGLAWLLLAIWLDLSLTYVLIAAGTTLLAYVSLLFGWIGLAVAISGIGTLSFTFLLLVRALLQLYRYPSRILAVAHTVVKESVRQRVSVSFIVVLIVLLPMVPLMVGDDEALRYRIQSFISWSMILTFTLAACMTIFIACGTVAFEIRDRQIWQLMTKPLSRFNYLLGKWIGIISVNFVLLIITGLSIFLFTQYLRYQPADNLEDRWAVENAVLAARVGEFASYERIDNDRLRELVLSEIENDFQLRQAIDNDLKDELVERQRIAREIQDEFLRAQRTVDAGTWRDFTFKNLQPARELGLPMRLRYRVHYGGEDTHENHPITFVIRKNGTVYNNPNFQNPQQAYYVPTMSHFLDLPTDAIGDVDEHDGTLVISIINGFVDAEGNISAAAGSERPLNFDADDLEVLYTVGGFEANYVRAMIVMWMKLSFLAMLGICAATVLSFPVACLMSFTIFIAAVIGPFLSFSLDQFTIDNNWRVDQWLIKGIATVMVALFKPFGELRTTQMLVDGRLIPWWDVLKGIGLIGFVWTGISLGLGFLFFRDRELATYSGQG